MILTYIELMGTQLKLHMAFLGVVNKDSRIKCEEVQA